MKFSKVKFCLKNKYFMIGLLTLAGLIIRLINIDKPSGLWTDEMLVYIYASHSFPLGIMKYLLKFDYHMPLYYYFVWGWMQIFGASDMALRMSSVFWGVLSIPAGYYLGEEFKSKQFGYLYAIIICLSPILIYYSQEVRFYSLIVFCSIVSMNYFLKLLHSPIKKNFIIFFLINLIILYSSTLGLVFVFAEVCLLAWHYYKHNKNALNNYLMYLISFSIISIPALVLIAFYNIAASKCIVNVFSWSDISANYSIKLIDNWFSPILREFYSGGNSYSDLIMAAPSTLCFFIGIIFCIRKLNIKSAYLILITLIYMTFEYLMFLRGDFQILTRYTLIVVPIILLLALGGIDSIKLSFNRNLIYIIIFLVFLNNAIINYRTSSSFMERPGLKSLSNFVEFQKPTKNDYVLYPENSNYFTKYLPNTNFIEFSTLNVLNLDKTKNEARKIFDEKFISTTTYKEPFDNYKKYLLNDTPTIQMQNFINSYVVKMGSGAKIFFLIRNYSSITQYKENTNFLIKTHNNISKQAYRLHLHGAMASKMTLDIIKILNSNHSLKLLKKVKYCKNNNFVMLIYQKI